MHRHEHRRRPLQQTFYATTNAPRLLQSKESPHMACQTLPGGSCPASCFQNQSNPSQLLQFKTSSFANRTCDAPGGIVSLCKLPDKRRGSMYQNILLVWCTSRGGRGRGNAASPVHQRPITRVQYTGAQVHEFSTPGWPTSTVRQGTRSVISTYRRTALTVLY